MLNYLIITFVCLIIYFSSYRLGSRIINDGLDALFLGLGFLSISLFIVYVIFGVSLISSIAVVIIFIAAGKNSKIEKVNIDFKNNKIIIGIIIIGFFIGFLLTTVPEVFHDTLRYHLGFPWQYVTEGKLVFSPYDSMSGFPQNNEMILTAVLSFIKDSRTADILNLFFMILFFTEVFLYMREYIKENDDKLFLCFAAAVLTVFTPGYFELGIAGKNGILVSIWLFYSVKYLLRYISSGDRRDLILLSLFSGFSLGTKYTVAVIAGIIAAILLYDCLNKKKINNFALFLFICFISNFPWIIKNIYLFKNPIYPFLSDIFNPDTYVISGNYYTNKMDIITYISNSLKLLINNTKSGSFSYIGYHYVLSIPILIFFREKYNKNNKYLYFIIIMSSFLWATIVRYFLFMVIVFWNIVFMSSLTNINNKKIYVSIKYIVIILAVFNICKIVEFENRLFNRFNPAVNISAKTEYIRRHIDYYDAAKFIYADDPKGKTILVGEIRRVYFNNPLIITGHSSRHFLQIEILNHQTAEEAYKSLRDYNIKYLIISPNWINMWKSYGYFNLNDKESDLFNNLIKKYFLLIYKKNNVYVFKIKGI